MKVQTVSVEIHEKRAHPSEMGHYDAKVEYTVQVDEGEFPQEIVMNMQFIARQQVADECDRWVADIKFKEEQDNARRQLLWIIDRVRNGQPFESEEAEFEENLLLLPDSERAVQHSNLEAARAKYVADLKQRLDSWIEKAAQGNLGSRTQERFYEDAALLGEIERQTFLERMEGALAPKLEAATQIEVKGSDVPF